MPASFLFYDLETFGSDPRRTRIAQFAALRTDADLNPVDDPISFFVQPADDLLPSPEATLITGITPQQALRDGLNEAQAFAEIHAQMARPQTTTLGYNSLRFDDEFIRYGLFRNFYDAYEREWRGGNSRWDLLDVMRLAHALRPDGIVWPQREDGFTSFKLEHLALANQVREGDAHEALSDVRALIGIARRLKHAQPRLWDYAARLRDKRYAGSLLDVHNMTPVLHVSQRYPAARQSAAPVAPLALHPLFDNRVIVYDLTDDPDTLLSLSPQTIAERLYLRQSELPAGARRIGLKEVHLNRSPALVRWDHLQTADLQRLQIDPVQVATHLQRLRDAGPALAEKIRQVYAAGNRPEPGDVDASLYDGFIDKADKQRLIQVRATPPQRLGSTVFGFHDPRLPELLLRYRARNWPDSLDAASLAHWNDYRRRRLLEPNGLAEYALPQFRQQIAQLREHHQADGSALALLAQLDAWGTHIEGSLQ